MIDKRDIKVDRLILDLVDSTSFKSLMKFQLSQTKVSCVKPNIFLANFIFLLNTNFTSSLSICIITSFIIYPNTIILVF